MDDLIMWLRREIETDRDHADLISAGGFVPQRWDSEPAGQVNPAFMPLPFRNALNAALIPDEEDRRDRECLPHWVQVVAYDRMIGEPPEQDCRDSDLPVMLIDDGRREASHVIRHDPRWVVADCEAKLAILVAHHSEVDYRDRKVCTRCDDGCYPCRTVRLLGSAYRHRPGYREEWKP